MIWYIILFSVLGSVGAVTTATLFTLFSEKAQKKIITGLISFATGTLLTAALLGLIPNALHAVEPNFQSILFVVLIGIFIFFGFEKIIIWRNCRNIECEVHGSESAGPIILLGDALHNFVDGIIITSAFLTNIAIGISVSIGIIAHEIPQETGDFGILLHSGFSKKKAYLYNTLSSSATIPAAIISFFVLNYLDFLVPYMLALSAASFIYIALSDLAPELHRKWNPKEILKQFILITFGIIVMYLLVSLRAHIH